MGKAAVAEHRGHRQVREEAFLKFQKVRTVVDVLDQVQLTRTLANLIGPYIDLILVQIVRIYLFFLFTLCHV